MILIDYFSILLLFSTFFFLLLRPPPLSTLFPYTTLFRSVSAQPRIFEISANSARIGEDIIVYGDDLNPQEAQVSNRSEEHTSELQSRFDLVCRLLLEKKKKKIKIK